MLPIAIPVVASFFIIKNVVKKSVSQAAYEAVYDGAETAKSEILRTLSGYQIESLVKIFINIIALLFSTLVLSMFFSKNVVIFSICTVYMVSIIDGMISTIKNIPNLLTFIFEYKFNLKEYIYDETYREAKRKAFREIAKMNFLKENINEMFGKSAHEYARDIAYHTVG